MRCERDRKEKVWSDSTMTSWLGLTLRTCTPSSAKAFRTGGLLHHAHRSCHAGRAWVTVGADDDVAGASAGPPPKDRAGAGTGLAVAMSNHSGGTKT